MQTKSLPKSIATVSLSGSLPEKLEAAAAIGFDCVEIFESDLLTFGGSPGEVRDIAASLGIRIAIFQPFRDFESAPAALRGRNLDRAERKFDVMEALGTDLVLVCSNVQPSTLHDPNRAAADLAEMAERAQRRGLRVGYEALAWGRHVNRWGQAWDIVQRAAHPALGIIVDSFHTLAVNDDPSGLATVPAEKIFFIQLADAPRLSMDVLSWSRHFRNFPGQGDLPVAEFLRAALASGYQGPLSLEVFNDEFRSAPASLTARDGLRSLILVEDEARRNPLLPPPPQLDGVDFLEFAVDEETRDQLARWTRELGFQHVGRHRSKDVDLYRQGRINLVFNAEPDSVASEHFQMHGPSVCAMGLRVDSTDTAIKRAAALLSPEWPNAIGEGVHRIPALRSPDGTLLHLVPPRTPGPSVYDEEFEIRSPLEESIGLMSIDHVAEVLPHGRLDSFVLFWRALFGMMPEQAIDLADPHGLIRSRAMVSNDRSVRLPLNISGSSNTAAARAINLFAGAGVHHIAFATDSIVRAVEKLTERGALMLQVPANYYDDLAARHNLEDDQLSQFQRLNLLYDRDEGGEFIHAYSRTFAGRFFFEIVERRGYQGFGAVNAPVRMAAQAPGPTAIELSNL
jgi:4-hydroxyphenylpyruvate dioxygenase